MKASEITAKTESQPKTSQRGIEKRKMALVKYNKKRKAVAEQRKKTLMAALTSMDKVHVRKLAKTLGVSKRTAYRLLNNKTNAWQQFLQKRAKILDAASLKLMDMLLARAGEGRFSSYQALVGYGILHDKTLAASKPLLEVSTGDRVIKVFYSNWDQAAKEATEEGQVEPTLQARQETRLKQPLRGSKPKVRKTKATTTRRSDWPPVEEKKKTL